MKIIRNDICYIELEDINYLGVLPEEVRTNIFYSALISIIKVKGIEAVNYFRKKDCIVDYDLVRDWSLDELKNRIKEVEDELAEYSSNSLLRNQSGNETTIKDLEYLLNSLNNYQKNKLIYDREFSKLEFRKGITKVKLNYMSACTKIEPLSIVPVSSSGMAELDRSIRNKCRDNGRVGIASKEMAEHYWVGSKITDISQEPIHVLKKRRK